MVRQIDAANRVVEHGRRQWSLRGNNHFPADGLNSECRLARETHAKVPVL